MTRTLATLRAPEVSVQSKPRATPRLASVSNARFPIEPESLLSCFTASHAHGHDLAMNDGLDSHSPVHAQFSHSSRRRVSAPGIGLSRGCDRFDRFFRHERRPRVEFYWVSS